MSLPSFPYFNGLEFPVKRTNRGFAVVDQTAISGARTRFAQRSRPIWAWEISFSKLFDSLAVTGTPFSDTTTFSDGTQWGQQLAAEYQALVGFYNSLAGTAGQFLWTETNDSVATYQIIGTGDGVSTQFQLVRALGGFTEPVYGAPVLQSLLVAGSVVSTGFSVSQSGMLTFAHPPVSGAPIVWNGTYSWVCRFDDDQVEFENFMSGFWALKSLKFSADLLP